MYQRIWLGPSDGGIEIPGIDPGPGDDGDDDEFGDLTDDEQAPEEDD